MPKSRIELGVLKPGNRFYFPNDHKKIVWTVLDSKRKDASHKKVFVFCESAEGEIEDYNSNREIYKLSDNEQPSFETEPVARETPVIIIKKRIPAPDIKPSTHFLLTQNTENDMEHKESSIKVFTTSKYNVFRMINGNRQLNERKISRIIKEINAGNDMLVYYPIQVKETPDDRLDILDSQHRFFISQKLKRPVYYILVNEDKSMPDIAKINSNVEKWKSQDFINCYVQHGNENYIQIQQFLDDYGLSLTVSLLMLKSGALARRVRIRTFQNNLRMAFSRSISLMRPKLLPKIACSLKNLLIAVAGLL